MATKSFNDICVEYAHQLGKGLPLTAPEMCNAVIMYLNTHITEMQGITTALQTAVSEAESSATEAINKADDVSETVNALPKVPTPTTSDNGKVIGVQSGVYALVEQSGGESPANMVTTNTVQQITAPKSILLSADEVSCGLSVRKEGVDVFSCVSPGIYRVFKIGGNGSTSINFSPALNEIYQICVPNKNGTFAITSDIPDLDNYTGTVHIIQGTAGSGIAVHDTAKASPYTKYGYDKIETYGNSNALQYTLNIPNKNGTIATLDDISSAPSPAKYFTRVIYHSTDDDTQYVIFSCITDTDLSANTSYQNVIDLLNYLGATTQDTALPCTGKTSAGDIVVGVYTDGSNIIVFNTDSTTEELNMSAEIKFISK